jgi:hypothetical protein
MCVSTAVCVSALCACACDLCVAQALLAGKSLARPCQECLDRESDSVCKECCAATDTAFCDVCWRECHAGGGMAHHVRHFYAVGRQLRLDRLKVAGARSSPAPPVAPPLLLLCPLLSSSCAPSSSPRPPAHPPACSPARLLTRPCVGCPAAPPPRRPAAAMAVLCLQAEAIAFLPIHTGSLANALSRTHTNGTLKRSY